MFSKSEPSLRVALLGLPAGIAEAVEQSVSAGGIVLYIPPHYPILPSLDFIQAAAPDLLFVWTEDHLGASTLEAVRKAQPGLPIVPINSRVSGQETCAALDSRLVNLYAPHSEIAEIQRLLRAANEAACC